MGNKEPHNNLFHHRHGISLQNEHSPSPPNLPIHASSKHCLMTMLEHQVMNSPMTPLQSRKGDESFRIHSGLEQHVHVSQLAIIIKHDTKFYVYR